jgi:glycosyltransferase involved in cell wall biosynthesis
VATKSAVATPRLTIGIDARAAAEVAAGRGRYVRELVEALAARDDPHKYVLYGRRPWGAPLDDRFEWWLKELSDAFWHRAAARAANDACDVFLATNSYVTPWFLKIPTALVVHDLIPFQPDVHANRRAALIEKATIRRALSRATVVLCDSFATNRDLVTRFSAAEPKSVVVQLAVGGEFARRRDPQQLENVRRRYGLDRPFVLCAGTLEPRKNLVRVFEAFQQLPDNVRSEHALVAVGPRGWEFDEILSRAQALGEAAKLIGLVPDEDLVALYQACEVFCYPSLYEGFGLPLLEAMSAGAPSITSNISSLPEVGGDAVRYVDPRSVDEIAAALAELLESRETRLQLSARAQERASHFSWSRVAEETLQHLTAAVQR